MATLNTSVIVSGQENDCTYGDGVGDIKRIDDVGVSITDLTDETTRRTAFTLHHVASTERYDSTQLRQV